MPALNVIGAPNAVLFAGIVGGLGAAFFFQHSLVGRRHIILGGLAASVVAGLFNPLWSVSTTKGHEHHAVLFSKWNSFSRIGVYDQPYGAWSLSDTYTGPLPDTHLMDIDSAAGTQIIKFNGDLKTVSYLQYELTALGYRLFDKGFNALVIGTSGDAICSALVFGALSTASD